MLITVTQAGYVTLMGAVLLGALGFPLPLTVALAAMGALARRGDMDVALLYPGAVVAAVVGDNLGYLIGRLILPRLGSHARVPDIPRRWHAAIAWCERHCSLPLTVFLTRWSLTAPASLVNLLAGFRRMPWILFLALDVAGQALWAAIAIAPGYLLGDDLEWSAVPLLACCTIIGIVALPALGRHLASSGSARQGAGGERERPDTAPTRPRSARVSPLDLRAKVNRHELISPVPHARQANTHTADAQDRPIPNAGRNA